MNYLRKINVVTVLIALLTFILGWQVGTREVDIRFQNFRPNVTVASKEPPKDVNIDFKLFWDTWELVSQKYIDKGAIDQQKMYYGAIQGMVAAVGDPYTVFLPPEVQKASKEDLGGSFEGVGIELGFDKEKRLVVVAPLDGTPAFKAGVKPQDLIVSIDKKNTLGMTRDEAVKLIRGPKGSEVTLTMFREGDDDTREVKLIRDTIVIKSVTLSFKDTPTGKKIGVIKLSRFGERTEEEWNGAVSEILAQGARGVILDVRNNPGGFLDGAVFISSEFLDNGDVVIQENSRKERFPKRVNRSGKLLKLPMITLVNKGSASASEIVAGALQDRKRSRLVGEKTFGKGTVQETEDLPGGTGIHITTHKWLTPNGRWANDTEGFEPDVVVEPDKEDDSKDLQMDKALELLN
jgi:carboxyl-terminal processing protease